ncbi:hypothetical protein SOVF_008180 [Spinacia oleracea]|uniref:Probable F-box protein At4g22030 n=1 Tax=Spinacia oleracea TaxID=3562 RepID=A0A9R0HV55_SPIOL|nr:probable F-box protein At4g22030 [Spinacia oleracea]KNA25252.1 hypothetical protein SOVF_008180 [Spinacia oleracea]
MTTLQSLSKGSISTFRLDHITQSYFVRSMNNHAGLQIKSAISIPKLPNFKHLKELNMSNIATNTLFKKNTKTTIIPKEVVISHDNEDHSDHHATLETIKLHVVLEAVLDRIEMHHNIGEQRENWNSLLLNSLNMITLTAATMAGMVGFSGEHHSLGLNVASTLLFAAGTGILLIMNKIQPSQLVEEQRNAVRHLKQLKNKIQMIISLRPPAQEDVEAAVEEVLALDRAYPLPLLGSMLEKFPNTFKPAVWWPAEKPGNINAPKENLVVKKGVVNNGWSKELEEEMKQIVGVIDRRDIEDYVKLGNKALKFNKTLAKCGPLLMGVATVGAAFGGPWGGLVAAVAGSTASVVNSIEHGGQVGMVFEMYRNCGGAFKLLEETIESNLEEKDLEKRENGELFEMKVALHLGRSLSELRDFAASSPKGEFASKLI